MMQAREAQLEQTLVSENNELQSLFYVIPGFFFFKKKNSALAFTNLVPTRRHTRKGRAPNV